MSFFRFVYNNSLWLSLPVFLLAAALLAFFIFRAVRVVKRARLLSVPVVEEQQVAFNEAGRVVLCTQSPPLSFHFAKLGYELLDDGRPLEGNKTIFHSRTSGLTWIRMEVKSFNVPRSGTYTLRVKGLQPGARLAADHSIVFMRPHLARAIACIIGMLLSSLLLIGSLVAFLLRVTQEKQPWLAARPTLILFGVIAGVSLLLFTLTRISKARDKAEKQFALAHGWSYTDFCNDSKGLTKELYARLEKVCPEKEFDLANSMVVESGRRSVFLFHCSYRVRDWGPKKNPGFACLVTSDRFASVGSQMDITGKNPFDRLLLSDQIEMGNPEFSRDFVVTSKNRLATTMTLNRHLQSVLLECRKRYFDYREINIGPGGVVILAGPLKPFDDWLSLVDMARRIEDAFE